MQFVKGGYDYRRSPSPVQGDLIISSSPRGHGSSKDKVRREGDRVKDNNRHSSKSSNTSKKRRRVIEVDSDDEDHFDPRRPLTTLQLIKCAPIHLVSDYYLDAKLLARPYVQIVNRDQEKIERMVEEAKLDDIDWDTLIWDDNGDEIQVVAEKKNKISDSDRSKKTKKSGSESPVVHHISSSDDESDDVWTFVNKKKKLSPKGEKRKRSKQSPSREINKSSPPRNIKKKSASPEITDFYSKRSPLKKTVIENKQEPKKKQYEPIFDFVPLKKPAPVPKPGPFMAKPGPLSGRPIPKFGQSDEKSDIDSYIRAKNEEARKKTVDAKSTVASKPGPASMKGLSMKQMLEAKARAAGKPSSGPIKIISSEDVNSIMMRKARKSAIPSSGVYHSQVLNRQKSLTAQSSASSTSRANTPEAGESVVPSKVRVSHITDTLSLSSIMRDQDKTLAKGPSTSRPGPASSKPSVVESPINPLLKENVKTPKPVPGIAMLAAQGNQVKNRVMANNQKKVSTDPYLADMLCWSPKWLAEAEVCKVPPPLYPRGLLDIREEYESPEHYAATQIPYIIFEVWENVLESFRTQKSKRGNLDHRKVETFCTAYELCKDFLKINIEFAPTTAERNMKLVPSEGDVVILEMELDESTPVVVGAHGPGEVDMVFGYITDAVVEGENFKLNSVKQYKIRSGCNQVIKLSVLIRKKPIRINQKKPIKLLRLEYIKPSLRQMEAVLRLKNSFLSSDILKPRKMTCQMAFPTITDLSKHQEYNLSQNQAILGVVEALKRPQSIPKIQLIQGPPGTGKTHTLVGMIKEIYTTWSPWIPDKLPKILVCAPSNGAVDEIGKRIYAERHFLKKAGKEGARSMRIVRVGQDDNFNPDLVQIALGHLIDANMKGRNEQEEEHFEKKICDLEAKIAQCDIEISNLRFANKMPEVALEEAKMVRYSREMERVRREKQLLDAASHGSSSGGHVNDRARRKKVQDDILKNADIILSTLNSCRCSAIESVFNPRDPSYSNAAFNCVIIDEASQCSEPEVLMPLAYTSISKMILIGDPMQLPATIKSTVASSAGYGRSLFERFFNFFKGYNPENPVHMLNEQYRMQAEICLFPAKMFYDNRLTSHFRAGFNPDPSNPEKHYYPFHPYTVIDVQNTAHSAASGSKSLQNIDEADFVIRLLRMANNYLTADAQIGVITPYQGQKKVLIDKINSCTDVRGLTVDVNTVDGFQGQERDFIIFSSVRSDQSSEDPRPNSSNKSIGFLDSHQRLNVALTRAKYAMVICVSRASLSHNFLWKSLIDDALERKRLFPLDCKSSSKQISNVLITSNATNLK